MRVSNVSPLYTQSQAQKRKRHDQEIAKSNKILQDYLAKHSMKRELVNKMYETKQRNIHDPHNLAIASALERNENMMTTKEQFQIEKIVSSDKKAQNVMKSKEK